jgi:16S rRNA (cytosine1402-N4)-methyltransferase
MPMVLSTFHTPVLLAEVINSLNIEPGKKYIDATLGGAGHTIEIARRGGFVLGIDQDENAIQEAVSRSQREKVNDRVMICKGNFESIDEIAEKKGFDIVDGILFDLGVSSFQIDKGERGFSFAKDETLDMRMDINGEVKALDIINHYSKDKLYEVFSKNSEELYSRSIANSIFRARSIKKINIETTAELVEIIDEVLRHEHPTAAENTINKLRSGTLARVFQALRIEVNRELEILPVALNKAEKLLKKDGRLAVISFHSLEDRIVKRFLTEQEDQGNFILNPKKPIYPKWDEIKKNPRSRSAKLRVAQKLK